MWHVKKKIIELRPSNDKILNLDEFLKFICVFYQCSAIWNITFRNIQFIVHRYIAIVASLRFFNLIILVQVNIQKLNSFRLWHIWWACIMKMLCHFFYYFLLVETFLSFSDRFRHSGLPICLVKLVISFNLCVVPNFFCCLTTPLYNCMWVIS